jgi:peroxiredoxin
MGDADVVQKYGNIEAIPTTFMIDKKGMIRAQYVGFQPDNVFRNEIKKLLAE